MKWIKDNLSVHLSGYGERLLNLNVYWWGAGEFNLYGKGYEE